MSKPANQRGRGEEGAATESLALIVPGEAPSGALTLFESDVTSARRYADEAKASSTRRAYRSDFAIFSAWCATRRLDALPAAPAAIGAFLSAEADGGTKVATLERRRAAIRFAHLLAGLETPTNDRAVVVVMQGIRRSLGSARVQKAAATAERMTAMLATIPETLTGKRDRALLSLGFSGAFRRSELVALEVRDLDEVPDGIRVTIRRSKTDQEGKGATIAILAGVKLRTVEALRTWIEASGIIEGPIFRGVDRHGHVSPQALTAQVVALIVKRYAEPAGLNVVDFSGHSLRAGFLTSAADAGADVFKMADVSRHKSLDVLRGYVRRAEIFKDHAGASFL